MRRLAAPALAGALCAALAGCVPPALAPAPLVESRNPTPLAAALAAYDAAPQAVRSVGSLRAPDQPSVDFGATVATGRGLRLDAVAGPFGSPVFALACRTGAECRGFDPSKRVVYVDEGASWEPLLADVLRGRVPRLPRAEVSAAGSTAEGVPVLVLVGEAGWQERVDFALSGDRPTRVFLGPAGEPPVVEVRYGEPGPPVDGAPFPSRVTLWTKDSEQPFEIAFRRTEPAPPDLDPGLFSLTVPPGTPEKLVRGNQEWASSTPPPWIPLLRSMAGPKAR